MTRVLTSSRVMLAVLAWLAQLCLPVAHAMQMPSGMGLGKTWCGMSSAMLVAKAAELPAEIREVLALGAGTSHQGSECAQHCAASGGPALAGSRAVTEVLREAGLELQPRAVAPGVRLKPRVPPPARGPPSQA